MKILMLESTHFDSFFRVGCHHYAEQLARMGHEVFFISHYISPLHRLSSNVVDIKKRIKQNKMGVIERMNGLKTYVPFTLFPVFGNKTPEFFSSLSLKDSLFSIKKILADNGFRRVDALILSHVQLANILKIFKDPHFSFNKLIYRCTDDIVQFPDIPSWMNKIENNIAEDADEIVCTSMKLVEKFQNIKDKKRVHYIPNGVDFERFSSEEKKNSDILKLTEPVIVYVGAIEKWFDVELLKKAAEKFPLAEFVIIGPERIDIDELKRIKNMNIWGPKNYGLIPSILKASDVGIIPFKRDNLIESVSPIKLFEYLSAGLPVVSTSWNEIERINSPAILAKDHDEFLEGISKAIYEKEDLSLKSVEYAKNCQWLNRCEKLLEVLEN